MTLKNFSLDDGNDQFLKSVSEIGSMLFTRGVSGTRVITGREEKIFQGNHVFKGNYQCLLIINRIRNINRRFNVVITIMTLCIL